MIDPIRDLLAPEEAVRRGVLTRWSAMELFVLSFVVLVLVGTAGYLLLPGLYTGERLGFLNALFTATSAVCVTGLIVVDTATFFTPAGQLWTLLLIQAGGLGVLTFTTLVISALGGRGTLGLHEATGGQGAIFRHIRVEGLLRTVMTVTFTLEAVGAVALWLLWAPELGATGALWPAVFHAISAFCNAGFSTFSDSLVGFRDEPLTLLVVSALVVAGGLGFIVVEDLRIRFLDRTTTRLTLHTKLVLATTGALLVGGWMLFLAFERGHELAGLGPVEQLANAAFLSVTPRTAGFNNVDYAQVTNPSLFLTVILMVIGGSPASTAGGLKTVTLALLVLLLLARLRGQRHVMVFGKTVPAETIQRAAGVAIGGIVLLACTVFLLLVTEAGALGADREDLVQLFFEAHSAFGTVGLSMGVTGELSPAGKVLIAVMMFLGRVGPPSVVAAMTAARERERKDFRYGAEDVLVG